MKCSKCGAEREVCNRRTPSFVVAREVFKPCQCESEESEGAMFDAVAHRASFATLRRCNVRERPRLLHREEEALAGAALLVSEPSVSAVMRYSDTFGASRVVSALAYDLAARGISAVVECADAPSIEMWTTEKRIELVNVAVLCLTNVGGSAQPAADWVVDRFVSVLRQRRGATILGIDCNGVALATAFGADGLESIKGLCGDRVIKGGV